MVVYSSQLIGYGLTSRRTVEFTKVGKGRGTLHDLVFQAGELRIGRSVARIGVVSAYTQHTIHAYASLTPLGLLASNGYQDLRVYVVLLAGLDKESSSALWARRIFRS